jgi:hypothetical protein
LCPILFKKNCLFFITTKKYRTQATPQKISANYSSKLLFQRKLNSTQSRNFSFLLNPRLVVIIFYIKKIRSIFELPTLKYRNPQAHHLRTHFKKTRISPLKIHQTKSRGVFIVQCKAIVTTLSNFSLLFISSFINSRAFPLKALVFKIKNSKNHCLKA